MCSTDGASQTLHHILVKKHYFIFKITHSNYILFEPKSAMYAATHLKNYRQAVIMAITITFTLPTFAQELRGWSVSCSNCEVC